MSSEKAAIDIGIDINRYKIISKIGDGGFSKVYRVKDLQTNKYYAAKISNFMIDDATKENEETLLLFREVNLMSLLNHPSVLEFVGYYPTNFEEDPVPTIITELATNGSLRDIINMEIQGLSPDDWDFTTKLINIYGIASGMSYLHSHNVLHRDLKPENILMNDYLQPKISDFGLSKITDFLSVSMNIQSQKGLKGTPAYMAPEIFSSENYSKSSDVYAFAFIVFEILTCEEPFKNVNFLQLMKKVVNDGFRPKIREDVPQVYRDLIERCWSQDPSERPSFDQIVSHLKTKSEFITELVDEIAFYDYVEFIDNCRSTFDVSKRTIHFEDFIKAKGRIIKRVSISENFSEEEEKTKEIKEKEKTIIRLYTSNIRKVDKNETNSQKVIESEKHLLKVVDGEIDSQKVIEDETNSQKVVESEKHLLKATDGETGSQKVIEDEMNSQKVSDGETCSQKVIEDDKKETKINENDHSITNDFAYPSSEFNKLTKVNQSLVEEAQKDFSKRFEVIKSLIEGKNGFPKNIELGIQYIEQLIDFGYNDAIFYYVKILIKGKFIPENQTKARQYISKLSSMKDNRFYLVQGLLSRKNNKFNEAFKYFEEGSKLGERESKYQYGKMLFLGESVKKNEHEAIKYMSQSKDLGFEKSDLFLTNYQILKNTKEFTALPAETQMIFITNNIKNNFDMIFLSPKKTEKLFFNKSLKSPNFYECLKLYKNISIEVENTSQSFKSITDLLIKIKNKNLHYIEIGVVLTSFSQNHSHKFLSESISYQKINSSITNIPEEAFTYCNPSTHVIIPTSVLSIGHSAFFHCEKLTKISFEHPSSLLRIEYSAFFLCESLTEIVIPSSVTSIERSCFSSCYSLKQILFELPSSITSIGDEAFNECKSLKHFTIPSSVTLIGNYVFKGCSSITEIIFPSSLNKLGHCIFNGCTSLVKVSIPSSITKIDNSLLNKFSTQAEIIIPQSTTTLGRYAFFLFPYLKKITITASIKAIKSDAFCDCSSLIEITIPPTVTSIGEFAFSGCSSLLHISIPPTVTSIGESAFFGCSSLLHISIPTSLSAIKLNTFSGCSSLSQVTIENNSSLKSIGEGAFSDCKSLKQISIPSSVTTIGRSAFERCSVLSQVSIPSSVTKIDRSAFERCSSLSQVTFENNSSLKSIVHGAFSDCTSLKQISIPSPVTTIDKSAFSGCSSLSQVTFENNSSLESIGHDAFFLCTSLKQISIPSSVTTIDESAFSGCSSLSQVIFENNSSLKSIGFWAFKNCTSLKQISIPPSVTKISEYTFDECSSLKQITIPSSLSKIIKVGLRVKIKKI